MISCIGINIDLQEIKRHCVSVFMILMFTVSAFGGVIKGDDAVGEDMRGSVADSSLCTVNVGMVLFPFSSSEFNPTFSDNSDRIAGIRETLDSIMSVSNGRMRVVVTGSTSPEGRRGYNHRLASRRAAELCRVLGEALSGIPEIDVEVPASAPRDKYRSLRNASIKVSFVNAPPSMSYVGTAREVETSDISGPEESATSDDGEGSESDGDDPEPECPAVEEDVTERDSTDMDIPTVVVADDADRNPKGSADTYSGVNESRWPHIALSTNMLYDLVCVPNIAVGVALSDRITVGADWMCAWWSRKPDHFYYRVYGGDVDLRYCLFGGSESDPFSGHHIGLYASMVCYDFQFGNHHTGVLSDKWNYAAGVSYTWSLPVGRKFNIDFSAGVGYMWGRFKKHYPIDDHDVWKSTHRQSWFGPTRLGVSLTYLLGPSTFNPSGKKGGER